MLQLQPIFSKPVFIQNQFSFKISFQIQELFWRNGFHIRSLKLQKDILQKMSQNIQHKFIKNYIPLFHPHFYKICAIFLRSSYPQHYGRHVTTTLKIFNIIKVTRGIWQGGRRRSDDVQNFKSIPGFCKLDIYKCPFLKSALRDLKKPLHSSLRA